MTVLFDRLHGLEVVDHLLTLVAPICTTTAVPLVQSYRRRPQQIEMLASHWRLPGLQGSGVTVAVVGMGIEPTHREFDPLIPRLSIGYTVPARQAPYNYKSDNAHGTHKAGTIAAAVNGLGSSV